MAINSLTNFITEIGQPSGPEFLLLCKYIIYHNLSNHPRNWSSLLKKLLYGQKNYLIETTFKFIKCSELHNIYHCNLQYILLRSISFISDTTLKLLRRLILSLNNEMHNLHNNLANNEDTTLILTFHSKCVCNLLLCIAINV